MELNVAQIAGTGGYLPGEAITNAQVEALVGPLPADILDGIQVRTRHWIVDLDTFEHTIANSEMAYRAAAQALQRAGIDPSEVELIICATASPDQLLPPMSMAVQSRLGLQRCAVTDIRSGCNGFIEGLDLARLYVERGQYQTAVVIGSEAISPILVPVFRGKDPDKIRMRDRMNPYNFGDGAAAVVVRGAPPGSPGLTPSAIAAIGGLRRAGMQIDGGGTATPLHEQAQAKRLMDFKVDVVESGRFSPHVIIEGVTATLEACGMTAEEVDVVVIPEGNAGYITDELEEAGLVTPTWKTIEAKVRENLSLVGATGSAAVPIALNHLCEEGTVTAGMKVMLLAVETSKWAYGGMVCTWTAAAPG
ncbi:MAG TPA: 3-oxoacyl-ACP synthase III family protein [Euzebya sp.]|nr:3-oxoacyl-ACP synthase III family protein [Euzebya sp.]